MSDFLPASHFQRLVSYNKWAWDHIQVSLQDLVKQDRSAYFAKRPFFWESLHGLMAHGYAAEWIWLERLHGRSPNYLPRGRDFTSLEAILTAWRPVQEQWVAYVQQLSPTKLGQIVPYYNTTGGGQQLMTADILQHVMNHATEHRSQMTPLLAQLGFATPPLDYMRWALASV
ncbi:MAG: DinB family protein [Ardenticatenaceae bacterium]|nr:DinB family protein [Ardenticatenaceae bacterium]